MITKPPHLTNEFAVQFKDRDVVEAYKFRPPYPLEVFEILSNLMVGGPNSVLDIGCGTGDIARGLVKIAKRVDAVDFSPYMIETGKKMIGGDSTNLNWTCAKIEDVCLSLSYNLVTAASSLHWMDWHIVLPRLKKTLASRGHIAIITRENCSMPWEEDLRRIIRQFSTNQDLLTSAKTGELGKYSMFYFHSCNLVEILEQTELFCKNGEMLTMPFPFSQDVNNYIESFHSRNGLSRSRMGREKASAFDGELRKLVSRFSRDGFLDLQIAAKVVWGKPK